MRGFGLRSGFDVKLVIGAGLFSEVLTRGDMVRERFESSAPWASVWGLPAGLFADSPTQAGTLKPGVHYSAAFSDDISGVVGEA